jgi:hypothetical protein
MANKGIQHLEGGWPKDVDSSDVEHTLRYRRKVEKDEDYARVVKGLSDVRPSPSPSSYFGFERLPFPFQKMGRHSRYFCILTMACRIWNIISSKIMQSIFTKNISIPSKKNCTPIPPWLRI